jgi:hypothetical protein
VPVLHLYHLRDEQLQRLHDIMLVNGDSPAHDLRSKAKAHLGEYDTHDGRATVYLHGEDTEFYTEFNAMLSRQLGMTFPNMPVGDYRKMA